VTIWKYEVAIDAFTHTKEMPRGARILHVAAQYPDAQWITFWALVDEDAPREQRTFRVYGTGFPLPDLAGSTFCDYVGSATFQSGQYVWHLFEGCDQ
jgi:hypothetical protein